MKLIESKTLATAAASIEFTSIPQSYTDLVIMSSARHSTSDYNELYLTFNSQTLNRSEKGLFGTTAAGSFAATTLRAGLTANSTLTSNTFSNSTCYIPNYNSNAQKTLSINAATESNAASGDLQIVAGLWSNSAPITSIQLLSPSGNFVIGSMFSLYGILKGSDGIVTTS